MLRFVLRHCDCQGLNDLHQAWLYSENSFNLSFLWLTNKGSVLQNKSYVIISCFLFLIKWGMYTDFTFLKVTYIKLIYEHDFWGLHKLDNRWVHDLKAGNKTHLWPGSEEMLLPMGGGRHVPGTNSWPARHTHNTSTSAATSCRPHVWQHFAHLGG